MILLLKRDGYLFNLKFFPHPDDGNFCARLTGTLIDRYCSDPQTLADVQIAGNRLVALPLGEQAEDVTLALRQFCQHQIGALGARALGLAGPIQQGLELLGHYRRAADDALQGADQLVRLHVLEQVALGPVLQGTDEVLALGAGGR